MDTSAVAQSVQALNEILMSANAKTTEMAEKLMKVSVEMAVGQETGKGQLFDAVA